MFEGKSEKGLFTFYWEQGQTQRLFRLEHEEASTKQTSATDEKSESTRMEEKKESKKYSKRETVNTEMRKTIDDLLLKQDDKQNRNCLIPKYLNLEPTIEKKDSYNLLRKKIIKEERDKAALPFIRKDENIINIPKIQQDFLQKIVFREELGQCHRYTIEINEQFKKQKEKKCKANSSNKIKRTIKVNRQSSQKEVNSYRDQTFTLEANAQIKTNRFPHLIPKHQTKKYKTKLKQGNVLEQVIIQRNSLQSNKGNSVVTIGVSSQQQYQQKWRRRKQQFLALLNRSLASNPISKR